MMSEESSRSFVDKKVGVLVPTYNNSQTLGNVLRDILLYTDRIIVVNDGSTDETSEILLQFPQIDLVSYPKNQGKGNALRKGFKRAIEKGYDYVISIDSDGQHFAEDLPKFLEKLEGHPTSIIMGVRNMAQAGIPGKSSFGHKFSNFWFWVETGIKMNDTQSGYRLYPLRFLQHITFLTKKFEFEIEVMVRAVWKGATMAEVPVKIFYAPREKRVFHFRPFRDFTRISILNTFLVTVALLYIKPRDFIRKSVPDNFWRNLHILLFNSNQTDAVKALSVGFGVFMGIVPLWGFQLLVGIALSFVFKLNRALVIIAANISIPPMIPLILFLSHLTGTIWMGKNAQYISFNQEITLPLVRNNSIQYLLGAITLAIGAGVFFTAVTYLGLKIFRKAKT
jgi:glycosyltransferase involved in cell wall biosynthesis